MLARLPRVLRSVPSSWCWRTLPALPAVAHLPVVAIAEVVDRFYSLCGELVAAHGGRVVKFSGDNCLAVFDPVAAPEAVACAVAVRDAVQSMGRDSQLDLDLGANVHLATVVTGSFGVGSAATDDVVGVGVIHTYRMGAGPDPHQRTRVSQASQFLSGHRGASINLPATYSLEA
jgi:class 3 adenylate cyclase